MPNVPQDFYVKLDWLPDDPDTGRKIDPFTRTQVESAYLRAWLQWNISYLRGHPYGLEELFYRPGPGRRRVLCLHSHIQRLADRPSRHGA